MRHGSTRVISSMIVLGSIPLVAGCVTTGSTSSTPTGGRHSTTVRTTIDVPAGFDPAKGASLPDFLLARMSFDTLLRKDTGGIVGGLATKWTATPTTATFILRADATCADGTKVTPAVVKASLEHLAAPATAASSAVNVFGPGNLPKVTADDAANSVTVTIDRPWDLISGLTNRHVRYRLPGGPRRPQGPRGRHGQGCRVRPLHAHRAAVGCDVHLRAARGLHRLAAAQPKAGRRGAQDRAVRRLPRPDGDR